MTSAEERRIRELIREAFGLDKGVGTTIQKVPIAELRKRSPDVELPAALDAAESALSQLGRAIGGARGTRGSVSAMAKAAEETYPGTATTETQRDFVGQIAKSLRHPV